MGRSRTALVDVDEPLDTSKFAACDDLQTAYAIECVRARLLRKRKSMLDGKVGRSDFDRVIAGLRRLQNPQLAAYRNDDKIVLSEPFNGVPSVVSPACEQVAGALIGVMLGAMPPPILVRALSRFGESALRTAVEGGVRMAIVPDEEKFSAFSPALARGLPTIDAWSAPPSGLFVVEERRLLLRRGTLAMTAAHEFGHALDTVLASRTRSYYSFESEELRYYFATATGYVNEYAASGLDEYFAESLRAYVEVNDSRCTWLPLTRQDLYLRDPRMFALIERLFRSGVHVTERRFMKRRPCRS